MKHIITSQGINPKEINDNHQATQTHTYIFISSNNNKYDLDHPYKNTSEPH